MSKFIMRHAQNYTYETPLIADLITVIKGITLSLNNFFLNKSNENINRPFKVF